ncbi:MAG TPA: hypothetical protein VHX86_16025 [Tepidisphaeraceae bacterium]|nr:hypothetical protein [Tepidisphaeraceae bacterium]
MTVSDTGFEHNAKTPEKPLDTGQAGADSGAFLPSGLPSLPPGLKEIIAGWSRLPPSVQAGILAIFRGSSAKAE